MARDEDAQQEWVFTLYEFDSSGKVAKDVGFFHAQCLSKDLDGVFLNKVYVCVCVFGRTCAI